MDLDVPATRELIDRARRGDDSGLAELVERFEPWLRGVIRRRFIRRMRPAYDVAGFDHRADADHLIVSDAVVDHVGGVAPAAADLDHSDADRPGVDGGDKTRRLRRHIADDWRGRQVERETVDKIGGAAQRGDHLAKALSRGASFNRF